MSHKTKKEVVRHDHPVQKAVYAAVFLLALAISVWIAANERYGWVTELTWRNIYQKTELGVAPFSELPCRVRVLDVGAGDCVWVSCLGTELLIDTGLEDTQHDTAAELRRCGLKKLDCLIITHYHTDHSGGIEEMLKQFAPNLVVLGPRTADEQNAEYGRVQTLCRNDGSSIRWTSEGDVFTVGPLQVEILWDGAGCSDENNRSLVVRIRFGNTAMLFMGDAEETTEKGLIASGTDLSADWIKLGHHGSDTSSTEELLQAVSPSYAAITCDAQNPPEPDVLKRLRARQITYARSDLNGAVLFSTDGIACRMDVQRGKKIE